VSLPSALLKLQQTLILTEFGSKAPELGIPESWPTAGQYLQMYLDVQSVVTSYAGIQTIEISEQADCVILFAIHRDVLPAGKDWFFYRIELAEAIQAKILQDTEDRVYEDDGDAGFRVEVVSKAFQFDPKEPIAYCKVQLRLSQYFS
jgi:hypothetical protein